MVLRQEWREFVHRNGVPTVVDEEHATFGNGNTVSVGKKGLWFEQNGSAHEILTPAGYRAAITLEEAGVAKCAVLTFRHFSAKSGREHPKSRFRIVACPGAKE